VAAHVEEVADRRRPLGTLVGQPTRQLLVVAERVLGKVETSCVFAYLRHRVHFRNGTGDASNR